MKNTSFRYQSERDSWETLKNRNPEIRNRMLKTLG